jgi:uncharacterized protein YecT (DUF1311 family)
MKYLLLLVLLAALYEKGFSQTQFELNKEAATDLKKAEDAMNRIYRQVMNKEWTPAEKDLIVKSQEKWIAYKEAHCKSISDQYKEGTIYPLIFYSCERTLTEQRKKNLEMYLEH